MEERAAQQTELSKVELEAKLEAQALPVASSPCLSGYLIRLLLIARQLITSEMQIMIIFNS